MVRDKVLQGVIHLLHIRTQRQLADLLTKALSAHQFHALLSKMSMTNIHSPIHLEGECESTKINSKEASSIHKKVKKKAIAETKDKKETVVPKL